MSWLLQNKCLQGERRKNSEVFNQKRENPCECRAAGILSCMQLSFMLAGNQLDYLSDNKHYRVIKRRIWAPYANSVRNADVDSGWGDQCECRCSRSAALVRISTNIKVGLLFLFTLLFSPCPLTRSLPACSCTAINRRATVPYF